MINNTETDVSLKINTLKKESPQHKTIEYTDEEIEYLLGDEVEIEMQCTTCKYIEEVPEWVLEEFLEIELLNGERVRRYSCQCPRCNKTMFRKT